jgi:hypothetical protein
MNWNKKEGKQKTNEEPKEGNKKLLTLKGGNLS